MCDNCYNVLSSGKIQSDQESRKRTAPTPPRKAEKGGDETSSGEENSDDEDAPPENPASIEYQVPTTPTFYQGNQVPSKVEVDGGYAELAQTNSNEV